MKYTKTRTNFIWVNINVGSRMAHTELHRRNVIIRPESLWGFKNYIRISIGTLAQTNIYIKVLDEIKK